MASSVGRPRRILMCEPAGYGVHHILNEWMAWDERVDVARAIDQWLALHDAIVAAGASVELMPHRGRSGAMTFTRDTAVVTASGEATLLRNHGRRGDLEPAHVRTWLAEHGFVVDEASGRIDGGNVVPTTDGWLLGVPPLTSPETVRPFAQHLRQRTGAPVHGVPIGQARFGHLDTALSDLAGRAWLVYPDAFRQPDLRSPTWEPILRERPIVAVTQAEAEALACNVLVVGECVIGGLTPRLCREIDGHGLHAVPVDLDEFRKAGGGAHCLTLELEPIHDPDRPPTTTRVRRTPCPAP